MIMILHQLPLSSSPYQEQTIDFLGRKIRITLRFNSIGNFWAMDVFEPVAQKIICEGTALVCGVPLLIRTSQPYFFWLSDESGANLDPLSIQDLGARCLLFVGEKA